MLPIQNRSIFVPKHLYESTYSYRYRINRVKTKWRHRGEIKNTFKYKEGSLHRFNISLINRKLVCSYKHEGDLIRGSHLLIYGDDWDLTRNSLKIIFKMVMGLRLHKLPRHMSRLAPTVYINMSSIERTAVLFHWLCFLIFDKMDYRMRVTNLRSWHFYREIEGARNKVTLIDAKICEVKYLRASGHYSRDFHTKHLWKNISLYFVSLYQSENRNKHPALAFTNCVILP